MNIPFVSTIDLVLQTAHPKTSNLGGSPKLRNSLPKGQVVLECEMPAGFFSFLGGKKKKEKNSANSMAVGHALVRWLVDILDIVSK
jgi:hypothetical protein